ncbi:MAG: Cytochrome c, class precursor [Betaproteobacteria bacterium]|nr:Cytochrome c, class precursor [Betaproteobacteria bacterium]
MRASRAAVLLVAGFALSGGVLIMSPLSAQEAAPAKTLTPGKGADLTLARCGLCHEITHITRSRLSRGEWQDNVKNMIERGMPIAPDEIPLVIEYLATYYNRDSAAPAPDAAVSAVQQDPVQRLLAENACTSCHGVEQKIVGPSFREVAVRYAGDSGAAAKLAAKIKSGGAGVWGAIPMPAHGGLSDAELAQLATWVLGRK